MLVVMEADIQCLNLVQDVVGNYSHANKHWERMLQDLLDTVDMEQDGKVVALEVEHTMAEEHK